MSHRHNGESCGCLGPSRRALLAGLAAAWPLARARAADTFDPAPRRVDVHHHFFPPGYLDKMAEVVGNKPSPLMTGWSAAGVIEHMDKTGVATGDRLDVAVGPAFQGRGAGSRSGAAVQRLRGADEPRPCRPVRPVRGDAVARR